MSVEKRKKTATAGEILLRRTLDFVRNYSSGKFKAGYARVRQYLFGVRVCWFLGRDGYDCHKNNWCVDCKVPHHPKLEGTGAIGKPCCGTCRNHWKNEGKVCYFTLNLKLLLGEEWFKNHIHRCNGAVAKCKIPAANKPRHPDLSHLGADAEGQPMCQHCFRYWRYSHLTCWFAGKAEFVWFNKKGVDKGVCHDEESKKSICDLTVSAKDFLPGDSKGQPCCRPCKDKLDKNLVQRKDI